MNVRLSSFIISTFLLLFCSVGSTAFAYSMPFGDNTPQPILITLDKSLNNLQSKEQFPSATLAEEQNSITTRKAKILPTPESRIVEIQSDTSFFGLSVGMYDPLTHNEKSSSFNLEWQPGVKIAGILQPIFGAVATTNGSLLGYGGIGIPFNITDRIFMLPSIAVGAYKKGDGYDLDGNLAFRIGTELAYRFDDNSRIGLNIHILTNGISLGCNDRTEIIGIAYTMPFEVFSKPTRKFAAQPKKSPQ